MRQIPEVGDVVNLKSFSFTNMSGGTGMSDWDFNPRFKGTATVKVVRAWEDDETGWRYWGAAESEDLVNYMDTYADPKDWRVLFSEFDVEKQEAK